MERGTEREALFSLRDMKESLRSGCNINSTAEAICNTYPLSLSLALSLFFYLSLPSLSFPLHHLSLSIPPLLCHLLLSLYQDDFLFSVSIVSGVMCIILSVFKFMLGRVLTSRALITDGFNSLVGGVMGFSILISAEVFKHDPKVWYLDGSIGVLIGLIILAYGVKLLVDMVPRVRQTRNYERFE
ncbi:unnamed protein product [Oncorhynchus mykiss]|uniref:Uncharacterized protein n=1 Tax=Oncorhynchus mykiss TaxID=8022 RepID=A0A060X2G5_ONCMY|nr:unnamed protein product [Oncorhynchus mykiss]